MITPNKGRKQHIWKLNERLHEMVLLCHAKPPYAPIYGCVTMKGVNWIYGRPKIMFQRKIMDPARLKWPVTLGGPCDPCFRSRVLLDVKSLKFKNGLGGLKIPEEGRFEPSNHHNQVKTAYNGANPSLGRLDMLEQDCTQCHIWKRIVV